MKMAKRDGQEEWLAKTGADGRLYSQKKYRDWLMTSLRVLRDVRGRNA
jgi:hypothetical protein